LFLLFVENVLMRPPGHILKHSAQLLSTIPYR